MALDMDSVGYPGELDDVDFARIVDGGFGRVLSGFEVVAGAPGARRLRVKAGTADGQGIRDTLNTDYTDLAGAVVGAGSRWDCVVLRRHWEDGADASSIVLLQGSAELAYPAIGDGDAQIHPYWSDVGDEHDTPLFLVRFAATQAEAQEFVDVRPFAGGSTVYLLDPRAPLPPWARLGQKIDRAGELWTRTLGNGDVLGWRLDRPRQTVWQFGRGELGVQGPAQVTVGLVPNAPPGEWVFTAQPIVTVGPTAGAPAGTGTDVEARLRPAGEVGAPYGSYRLVTIPRDHKTSVPMERRYVHGGGDLLVENVVNVLDNGLPVGAWPGSMLTLRWCNP